MTERIREFLRSRRDDGPCLVVDLDVVRDNFRAFQKALPDSKIFYAVKANPAPEIPEQATNTTPAPITNPQYNGPRGGLNHPGEICACERNQCAPKRCSPASSGCSR